MWILFFCTFALIQYYDALPLQRPTILQTMLEDPVLKNCNSTLLDSSTATFIEACNVQFYTDISKVEDTTPLLCLSYYDINRRLCEHRQHSLPHNTDELNALYSNITEQNFTCETIRDKLAFEELPSMKNYTTTLEPFLTGNDSCKIMCYTLKGHLKKFCKIFFWGNLVLSSPEERTDEPIIMEHSTRKSFVTLNEIRGIKEDNLHPISAANPSVSEHVASSGQENNAQLSTAESAAKIKSAIKPLHEEPIRIENHSPSTVEKPLSPDTSSVQGIDGEKTKLNPDNSVEKNQEASSLDHAVDAVDKIEDSKKFKNENTQDNEMLDAIRNDISLQSPDEEEYSMDADTDAEFSEDNQAAKPPHSPGEGIVKGEVPHGNAADVRRVNEHHSENNGRDADAETQADNQAAKPPHSPGEGIVKGDAPHSGAADVGRVDKHHSGNNGRDADTDAETQADNHPIIPPHSPGEGIVIGDPPHGNEHIPPQADGVRVNEHQSDNSGRGYMTGSLSADDDAEEGSFFPMFLSLVGLSALMYILFHNKNKILGLLVEGRVHSARRRGSHAYRRLDTLEHAVGAPAPPAHKATILY